MFIFDTSNASDGSYIDGSTKQPVQNDTGHLKAPSVLKGPAFNFPKKYPKTLAQAIIQAANTSNAITFVDERGDETELPYSELKDNALKVLASLQLLGATPGKAVILQLDGLSDFLTAFWACVLGGLMPVPVLPFRNANPDDSSFHKLQTITEQLDKPIILMSDRNLSLIQKTNKQVDMLTEHLLGDALVTTFSNIEHNDGNGKIYKSKASDIAFLQYTSGSTSFPKGTQLTNLNVLATIQGMILSLGINESTIMLNWMPYYHDMGIIAGHIMAVVSTCKVVALKPFTFVRRPILWLQKIDEHKVTVTFSPNFGLKRIVERAKPRQLTHLDLSSLEVILNGAEPISIQSSQRFVDLLHTNCGMSKECLIAGYGMAEASLAVSIAPFGHVMRTHILNRDKLSCGDAVEHVHAEESSAAYFADEGPVVAGMELRVVDENDKVLPVGSLGHVQIKGRSVTQGYFANEKANKESFCGKWFRTGDLGFVYDARFVITGRVKDVVFANGQNYYSHDFEHACEHIEGLERLVVIGHFDHERNEEDILAFIACNSKLTGAREKTAILRATQMRINQCFDVTPTMFIVLRSTGEIPKTSSGKIMRHKLLDNYIEGNFSNQCIHISELLEISPDLSTESDSGKHVTIAEFKLLIRNWWSEVLGISENAIGDHDPFYSLGGTSIKAIEVLAHAEETVDCTITHDMFKEHDTVDGLANYIVRSNVVVKCKVNKLVRLAPYREDLRKFDVAPNQVEIESLEDGLHGEASRLEQQIDEDEIAIIGMGCIFPQADNVEQFWQVLKEGRDCVTEFPNDRGNINEIYEADPDVDIFSGTYNKSVSKWGSFVETHHFDPTFFNINEQEAQAMDPHQSLFLNAVVQAVQDSGLVDINGSNMGVFVGASGTGFYQQREDSLITPSTLTGALANLAASRVSNAFNLKGPSLSVDTACSSSLVSVDLAVKSILNGESETAIAGGVQVVEGRMMYLMFSRAGILSPQGRCHAFSEQANGFVPGEGAGAVVLKRYRDAVRDGDRVYAVIKASTSNNDGASLGIMAPNPEGQENVIRAALSQAGINPEDIGYVEAHGTGTNIGDLIEVRSLSLAFNEKQQLKNQSCPIGSVKTNMGHQLAAAGISGLIKSTLAIYNKQIPASLHCDEANERKDLKLAETPFYVNRKLSPWPANNGKKRYAAVNSFGFGGTNAHVILSDAYHDEVEHDRLTAIDEPDIFCFSTKTESSLTAAKDNFKLYAEKYSRQAADEQRLLRNTAYSYNARRDHYKQNRVAIVAKNFKDAAKLAAGEKVKDAICLENRSMPITRSRIAWMFSGQGSQHPAMAKALYYSEPVFREAIHQCDEIAFPLLGLSLRSLLLVSTKQEEVSATSVTQPLVFAMDYALAKLWLSWGVKPDYMLGHSIGEYVAACIAGMFSLEDALMIVVKRGALMGSMPKGCGMTAVMMSSDELLKNIEVLDLPLDVAAYNGPSSTVISGDLKILEKLHARLDEQSIPYQALAVSHAFHSRHMEPMLEEFKSFLSQFEFKAPTIPIVSNVTGKLYDGNEAEPSYWASHIRQPVHFQDGINCLLSNRVKVFLEVGGQEHLTGLARRIANNGVTVLSSQPKNTPNINFHSHIATAMAKLYVSGIDIDWAQYYLKHGDPRIRSIDFEGDDRRKQEIITNGADMLSVPTYPFEKRSMFRAVGIQKYPFKHLFKRINESQYEYVPDANAVVFADHVVAQMPMLSGAGQCDLICHLHHLTYAQTPKSLRNISFHQPWLSGSKINVTFSGENDEKEFHVKNAIGSTVFKGCSKTVTSALIPEPINPDEIMNSLDVKFSGQQLYDIFNNIGIEYGTFHQNVIELHASETEGFAKLSDARGDSEQSTHGYFLHPGILDAAFQAAAGILLSQLKDDNGNIDAALPLMVPLGIESINIFKYLQDGVFYSHVTLADDGEDIVGNDVISCNVRIYNEQGIAIAEVNKLQMKRMAMPESNAVKTIHISAEQTKQSNMPAEFFHTNWIELPAIQPVVSQKTANWLMFGSPEQCERELAEALTDYGIYSILVPYEHYKNAEINDFVEIFSKTDDVSGIIFLGDHDGMQEQCSDEIADLNTMRLLFNTLKAISTHSRNDKSFKRIRFIRATRDAYQINETNSFDIRKSVSTGFLRTARIEFPLLDIRQVDFGDSDAANTVTNLLGELASPDSVAVDGPETVYNNGKRLSSLFEPASIDQTYEKSAVFNKDKTFWIIGGTSGVGELLSTYLAENYQPTLVLSGSRRLPPIAEYDQYLADNDDAIAKTIAHIKSLESLGSTVTYISTDIRSADSIRVSLDTIRQSVDSIDGVYFSALQLDDKMIVQKEWSGYRNMMDMRVYGLQELIRQTISDKLDFFVMFSSCTGLTGNIGQSDYSASDVYMDNIPYALKADNKCRYKSIQWGPWSLGQQVSEIVQDHLDRNGLMQVTPETGMQALENLLLSDVRSIAFMPGSKDANVIAKNLFGLRQGSSSRAKKKPKPKSTTNQSVATTAAVRSEEQTMSQSQTKPGVAVSGSQMQLLMREFEKQREMFMQLCESQNALLAGSLDELPTGAMNVSAVVTEPVVAAPAQAPIVATPVEVAAVAAPLAVEPEPEIVETAPVVSEAPAAPQGRPADLYEYVSSLMSRSLEIHVDDIDPDQNIMELGADSMTAMSLVKEVETTYDIELPATLLFEYSTLNELVEYLKTEVDEE